MIRTNLSTRPFYNERSVRLILLAVAIAVVAFTAFNASRVLRYSRSDTRLATQASRDEARAADLRQQAARLRATVDSKQIDYRVSRGGAEFLHMKLQFAPLDELEAHACRA